MGYPEQGRAPWEQVDTGIAAGVGALAGVIRLLHYQAVSTADPLFDVPLLDGLAYHDAAVSLSQGIWVWKGPFFQDPLYPLFLSIIYRFAPASLPAAIAVQLVMGTLAVVFLVFWWPTRRNC